MKVYKKTNNGVKKEGYVFKYANDGTNSNNKLYLVRCPKCKSENYNLMVSSGVCGWCGYRATNNDVTDIVVEGELK
jgi:predicted Zn-ribbon and HTH transcriptional regulator